MLQVAREPGGVDPDPPEAGSSPRPPTTSRRSVSAVDRWVRLEILNSQGRLVRVLVEKHLPPGMHYVEWDARDDGGTLVPEGTYLQRTIFDGVEEKLELIQIS